MHLSILYLRLVLFKRSVAFSGYDQLVSVVEYIDRIEQQVEPFVIADEPEEQKYFPGRIQPKLPDYICAQDRLAKLV